MNAEDELPKDRLLQPTTLRWWWTVVGFCTAYAVARYHIAGDVPLRHFPLFVLNKVTSLAAVIFVGCSYLIGPVLRWHNDDKAMRLVVIKFCGLMGFFLAAAHAFFSFMLMNPAYFAKYFEAGGRMNLQGELGMSAGVVALFFLLAPALTTLPMMPKALGGKRWKRGQRMGYLALSVVIVHLVVLGHKGWIDPSGWPASIPPISLVAVIAALIPVFVKQRRIQAKKRHEG